MCVYIYIHIYIRNPLHLHSLKNIFEMLENEYDTCDSVQMYLDKSGSACVAAVGLFSRVDAGMSL